MTEVYIKYNPYRLTTQIKVNGNSIATDSAIAQKVAGKRLQSWIGSLPEMLKDERGSREFKVTFHGNVLDYDDVADAFEQAKNNGILTSYQTSFEEALGDSEVYDKILSTYNDLMNDCEFSQKLDENDREGLAAAIKRIQNNIFPIHVIATMSSGKSTLINALLGEKLMPSMNEACTAIITEILDNNNKDYSAIVYDIENNQIKTVSQLTYEVMNELNANEKTARVAIDGDIPFIDETSETRLKLVDTPGPNNARNANHRETTYRNINSATENMILYVLNYTQLATNDDNTLLHYVAEEIKKGGKETRDRFIFVLNKIDEVGQDDSVESAIEITKQYLAKHGIEDPQIFPASAYAALGLQTLLKNIDPYDSDAVDEAVEETNNDEIENVARLVKKLNRKKELHLENYSTLTPSEQHKLMEKLAIAEENNDKKTTAFIHSGICSIQSAIKAYVQKYAKAKKIRDFVEPLEKQLNQVYNESIATLTALSGGEEAKELQKRSAAIKNMIEQGNEAKKFKAQIEEINPIPEIKHTAKKQVNKSLRDLANSFKMIGDEIVGKDNVDRFINSFSDNANEILSNLTVQLETLVEHEIKDTGMNLIYAYQDKLKNFDENVGSSLNFNTEDLVSGVLSRMKIMAVDYSSSGNMREQQLQDVDEIHEDREKTDYKYEKKTKTVTEKEYKGSKQVKVGEKKVVTGYHTETEKVKRGGLLGWLGFKKKVEKVYEDYTYEPVFKTEEIWEDVKKQVEYIDKVAVKTKEYVVSRDVLQANLLTPINIKLEENIEELLDVAGRSVENLKQQFMESFDIIDEIIKDKYSELDDCMKDTNNLEKRKAECKSMIQFITDNMNELNDALDI